MLFEGRRVSLTLLAFLSILVKHYFEFRGVSVCACLLVGQMSACHRSFKSSYLLSKPLAACVFLLAFAGLAFCQEATIVGTVTDPSGAVVPGVKSSRHQHRQKPDYRRHE